MICYLKSQKKKVFRVFKKKKKNEENFVFCYIAIYVDNM